MKNIQEHIPAHPSRKRDVNSAYFLKYAEERSQ